MINSPFSHQVLYPSQMEAGRKYPAVFALHGIGYHEQGMLDLLAEAKEQFILIGIRGHLTYENGYAYYYLQGFGNPVRELFDSAVNHLQDFISQAVNEYPVDPNRVYLLGFSQGAILSMTLALTMGNRIKGIVAMNGYIPGFVKEEYALQPMNRVSVFLTQGEFDHIFPPHVGQENYEYLRQHARAVKYTIYPEGHTISAEMQEDFLRWLERDAFGDNR